MKNNLILVAVLIAASLLFTYAAPNVKVSERKKRSFHSYFENYLDEMATSACVSIGHTGGLYFAVRRACRKGPSCQRICTSLSIRKQAQIWDKTKLLNTRCVDSLHVYKNRPTLADNKKADTDVNKVGMAIYRYFSCSSIHCGPNYCCCTGPQN